MELFQTTYSCMHVMSAFLLISIKIEHEYKEAQNIFHKNKVVHLHKHADNNSIKHEFFEEITINPTEKQANILSEKMVLGREFA